MSRSTRALTLLLLAAVIAPLQVAVAEEDAQTPHLVPSSWLGLPPLDGGGRAPFNPSTVFERYLWKVDAPPPKEGDTLTGTSGREGTWKAVVPDPKGNVEARGLSVCYTALEAKADGIWLAEVFRAGLLCVNGVPHSGDVYGHHITKVPVTLRKGVNHVYAAGFRGSFRVAFEEPPAPVFVASWDATLPDLVAGRETRALLSALVVNATNEVLEGEVTTCRNLSGALGFGIAPIPAIPPLGSIKVAIEVGTWDVSESAEGETIDVCVGDAKQTYTLTIRPPDKARRHTFVSDIDGSVQFYGVRPPPSEHLPHDEMGLVLSLHGAGVGALGQARAYSAHKDFWVVAATNRRPFGFDWQDWGRQDAYEVLADALRYTGVDRRNVHLTGHSMGGHGTWHIGANDPDGFASIAPSAGWISFDSYGRRPRGPLTDLWHSADRASLTLDLVTNLRDMPIYILHGLEDDNVPVREAKNMVQALRGVASDLTVKYIADKKHWWDGDAAQGTDCVDWPGFFDMFADSRIPVAPEMLDVIFPDLSLDADHHWVRVVQPLQYGGPCRVKAQRSPPDTVVVTTSNVRRIVFELPTQWGRPGIRLDGERLDPPAEAGTPQAYVRAGGHWKAVPAKTPREEKHPDRMGPFKRAFDNRFVLIYGTAGDDAEDAALLQRARYDAERWRYRANGRAVCVTDAEFLEEPKSYYERNVILYGNADTNAAWSLVFPGTCPIEVRRGRIRVGTKTWEGDAYGALFVYPRMAARRNLAAAVADTGIPGTRLGLRSAYFVSGVGYPDFVVFGPEVLKRGDEGVRVAGFFDHLWQLAD